MYKYFKRRSNPLKGGVLEGRSLGKEAVSRLFVNKAAVFSMVILAVIFTLSLLGPMVLPNHIDTVFWEHIQSPPMMKHFLIFGTDSNGRDLLVRTLFGIRTSLFVSFLATAISIGIGVAYGSLSGYMGGRVDNIMMRILDILYSMPGMFIIILLNVIFGRSVVLIYIFLGFFGWFDMARLVRGQTLSLKKQEFIRAANALGLGKITIITRHIIPNIIGPVIVYATLSIPGFILIESFLSYLGLGVQEPGSSLGTLISEGTAVMEVAPWMLVFPSATLLILMFAFNFLGDGLRDALDPKTR